MSGESFGGLQDGLAGENAGALRRWVTRAHRAHRAKLLPFRKLADSIIEHWKDHRRFSLEPRVSNGVMEASNGLRQLAYRLARGFRNSHLMTLLKVGKLYLDLPCLPIT